MIKTALNQECSPHSDDQKRAPKKKGKENEAATGTGSTVNYFLSTLGSAAFLSDLPPCSCWPWSLGYGPWAMDHGTGTGAGTAPGTGTGQE